MFISKKSFHLEKYKSMAKPEKIKYAKENVGMVIQNIPNSKNRYLSVIRSDGPHISSYPVSPEKLLKVVLDDFWVWKDRNFN